MRRACLSASVPLLVLLLALIGQVKEQVAVVAIVGGVALVVWCLGLGVVVVWHVTQKTSAAPALVGIGVSTLALLADVALVLDAPLWVQWRAAPAIAAIERTRTDEGQYPAVGSLEGDFPSTLRATLDGSGHCLYKPRGSSYHLACLSVPFTRCGYDGATRRWSGWE